MKFRMTKFLRFWVDCDYEANRDQGDNATKAEVIAEILREYEETGDAMRYLNAAGRIAWKSTPNMLRRLADAEQEVEDDMAELP
jgi:hypothetical protein